ncbi:MAG: transposase [Cyanobacteria bacterium J06628_3]
MAKKKKTIRQRCTSRVKNKSKDVNAEPFHQRRGIEACIEKIPESFEVWGRDYQSLLRKSVKLLQSGQTKEKLSPILQKKYDLQWAWVDSLLTDAKGTVDQLNTAKDNQISELKEDIESGQEKASKMIEEIQEALEKPTKKNLKGISKKLLGIKSKLNKNNRQKKKLANLESQ